jgi:two-component system OmpR family response regulator
MGRAQLAADEVGVPSVTVRILLAEDDNLLADALSRALVQSTYAVDVVGSGDAADNALAHQVYDLVILDIGLPGLSGLDVLRRLRARRVRVPVLLLTAMDALADRVQGLDAGADDYLSKPFDLPELEARVRALLRRGADANTSLMHGRLRLDMAARRVYQDEQPVDFSAREFAVLELLLMREGRVVSKEHMVNHLYGWGDEVGANAIEVYVHRIRKKLEPMGCEIRTVRGMGYLMEGVRAGEV